MTELPPQLPPHDFVNAAFGQIGTGHKVRMNRMWVEYERAHEDVRKIAREARWARQHGHGDAPGVATDEQLAANAAGMWAMWNELHRIDREHKDQKEAA